MLERLGLGVRIACNYDTGEHTRRVGQLSAELARLAGWPEEELEVLGRAATLHDIGKIGIPYRYC